MGSGRTFLCKDCRQIYYVGYGYSPSWNDSDTLATFDEWAEKHPEYADRGKNLNLRKCHVAHKGHDYIIYSGDYTSEVQRDNGSVDLEQDDNGVWVSDIGDYERFDMENYQTTV